MNHRKIAVVGPSGAGKSTVGAELAGRLGVPYVELDALVHGPNWTEASDDELRTRIEPVLAGDGWVIDGNYARKLGDLVVSQADTVLWLDLPLPLLLRRLWRRTLHRIRDDVPLWNENRESWRTAFFVRDSLFWWTIKTKVRMRRTMRERMARYPRVRLVRLRSQAAVDQWLQRQ